MKPVRLFICLFFLSCSPALFAQPVDSVHRFIDSALQILQHESIFAKGKNWKKISARTHTLAANATTYAATAPALHYAFNQLGDKHGWIVIDGKDYRNESFKPDTNRISTDIKAAAAKGPAIYARKLNDSITWISIPFFGGQTSAAMNRFAARIQDSLCKYTNSSTSGLIIDLRLNAGGNIFPMLVGLSEILGDGIVGISKNAKGTVVDSTVIINHGIRLNDTITIRLPRSCNDFSRVPVAVIIGPVTGSAGEGIAIAFKGRPHTILVGEATAGYTSSNQGFLLPGTDNGIVTAGEFMQDRFGNSYPDAVYPAIKIKGQDHFFDPALDGKINAAVRWLQKHRISH